MSLFDYLIGVMESICFGGQSPRVSQFGKLIYFGITKGVILVDKSIHVMTQSASIQAQSSVESAQHFMNNFTFLFLLLLFKNVVVVVVAQVDFTTGRLMSNSSKISRFRQIMLKNLAKSVAQHGISAQDLPVHSLFALP